MVSFFDFDVGQNGGKTHDCVAMTHSFPTKQRRGEGEQA